MTLIRSWIESANTKQTDFPLNNLPYGVFTVSDSDPHCCVAIGDMVLDVTSLEELEILEPSKNEKVFNEPYWNSFMELGPETWALFRKNLTDLLKENFDEAIAETKSILENSLIPQKDCILHMPFVISEFTDFFASYHHAKNVGTMFRGPENALPPNWLHIPIGYNGRASTVIVSGTDVKRPRGQLKPPTEDIPYFGPSKRFDFELELGAIVGTNTDIGTTLISPWIVTKAALEPFRKFTPKREVPLLKYLEEKGPMLYDIDLSVSIETNSSNGSNEITRTNYSEMYYSSAQQLAHHTSSGCAMSCGDLLGSGTISGPEKHQYGSMLELSWGGKNPIQLQGSETRTFLEDGDIIRMSGAADGGDYKIGFGENIGKIIPANK